MPQLTVIIPCKDEEHNIRRCIESARSVADEILVADSGSSDRTLEIVRGLGGCRIIEREYINSADFKNWAIPQASHPWVLICDADERVSPELADEIRRMLASEPPCDGYRIRFRTYFLGYPLKYSGTQSVTSVRLFRKSVARYSHMRVHADVIVPSGKVGRLKGRFQHYTCQCLNRYTQTQNRYTTWSALDMYDKGRRTSVLELLLRPPVRFMQFYLLRRGFMDGAPGLLFCWFTAYYTYLKYAKLWELERSRTRYARRRESAADNRTSDVEEYHRPAA
jgi:glycosyltransferase involved in cell wall biosynthesis